MKKQLEHLAQLGHCIEIRFCPVEKVYSIRYGSYSTVSKVLDEAIDKIMAHIKEV